MPYPLIGLAMSASALLLAAPAPHASPLLTAEPEQVDASRHVFIPHEDDRRAVLRVGALYNDDDIQLRYEFESERPSWYHQYWIFEDGDWELYGNGSRGPDPHGLYEDRISMMLDDGRVRGFDHYGGYMLTHDGMRTLSNAASPEEVRAHPLLGETLGRDEVRKYLPTSRDGRAEEAPWDHLKTEEALWSEQEAGRFLDLWEWQAHRSHPMGHASNGYVLHDRHGSEGRVPYTDNWDSGAGHPAWMYDPEITGFTHLERDRLMAREYGQDDWYFLSEAIATPFNPDHDWQEGDVLPQRLLREPSGSRGAIRAAGGYEDGAWRVQLTRSLEAPNPLDSKALQEGERYHAAFVVHTHASGARWHLVSHPVTLGLGVERADIVATRVEGALDEAEVEWTELELYYPGQTTWQWLHSREHEGRRRVHQRAFGLRDTHDDIDEMAEFAVELERELIESPP